MSNWRDKIKELESELRGLLPMAADNQKKLDKKFRLEFNYNSNHIEGNTLTYGETELLLIFDETTGNHSFREFEEMKAHDAAIKLVEELASDLQRPLTESFIRNLNKTILVKPFWKEAITPDGQNTRREIKVGDYKEFPNSVRLSNGEIFEYASVSDTPILMGELIEWYKIEEEKKELHPIELAAILHYKFVRIHPFDDGNGRISRLLVNYVLIKHNLPPIVIKSADKKNYLSALNKADVGDLNSFVEYIAQQAIWSMELSIKAAMGESIEERDDLDKEIEVWKKEVLAGLKKPVQRNNTLFTERYHDSIRPILIELNTKMSVFSSLFEKFSFNSVIDSDHGGDLSWLDNRISNSQSKVVRDIDSDVHEHLSENVSLISTIQVWFMLEKNKHNGQNQFNVNFILYITFIEFSFSIDFDNHSFEFSYDKIISEFKKNEIVTSFNKYAFDLLQRETK
jgi:Fic family protein